MPYIRKFLSSLPQRLLRLGGREQMRRPNFIVSFVQGKDVLDIGVVQHTVAAYERPSWIHKHICQEAAYCVGIDCLEEGVNFLRSKGFNVYNGNAETFDLGRKFDVVVAGEIIEHLDNVGIFLDNVLRHLNFKGCLVLTTPNPWFWGRSWQALFGEPDANPEHTAWFSIGMLRELLLRHGLEIELVQYDSGEDLPSWYFFLPARLRHTSIWLAARVASADGVS